MVTPQSAEDQTPNTPPEHQLQPPREEFTYSNASVDRRSATPEILRPWLRCPNSTGITKPEILLGSTDANTPREAGSSQPFAKLRSPNSVRQPSLAKLLSLALRSAPRRASTQALPANRSTPTELSHGRSMPAAAFEENYPASAQATWWAPSVARPWHAFAARPTAAARWCEHVLERWAAVCGASAPLRETVSRVPLQTEGVLVERGCTRRNHAHAHSTGQPRHSDKRAPAPRRSPPL